MDFFVQVFPLEDYANFYNIIAFFLSVQIYIFIL